MGTERATPPASQRRAQLSNPQSHVFIEDGKEKRV